jgi:hypothetical protein
MANPSCSTLQCSRYKKDNESLILGSSCRSRIAGSPSRCDGKQAHAVSLPRPYPGDNRGSETFSVFNSQESRKIDRAYYHGILFFSLFASNETTARHWVCAGAKYLEAGITGPAPQPIQLGRLPGQEYPMPVAPVAR